MTITVTLTMANDNHNDHDHAMTIDLYMLNVLNTLCVFSTSCLQVPDWHPGNPGTNREIFDQPTWQSNYVSLFQKLISAYPGVVGKLIIDIANVSLDAYALSMLSAPG